MRGKTFKIVGNDISDGYHTFKELYQHRCLLYLNLCLLHANECYWKPDYDGHFLLYWESPSGQISYHLGNEFLTVVEKYIGLDDSNIWDLHTSKDVVDRLTALLNQDLIRGKNESI